MTSRDQIRQCVRRRRRELPAADRRRAAVRLAHHLLRLSLWSEADSVAAYWPVDGEMDPRVALAAARRRGASAWLPVLGASGQALRFRRWSRTSPLRPNRYGIPEPAIGRILPRADRLAAVLVPLVAFDRHGNRLGMGGGFYDRTFATLRRRSDRTALIGVAFACQQVSRLSAEPWDVPLTAVVTERGILRP